MQAPTSAVVDHRDHRARRTTLKDVAAAAGVSAAVASRALAGHSSVAPATRQRVVHLAQQMGYRASRRALALRVGSRVSARCAVVTLGLSTPELSRSYYGPVITGIAAQASLENLDVHLLTITGGAADAGNRAASLARLVAEDRAEGLILLTFEALRPDDVRGLDDAGVPYVLVNRHFDYEGGRAVHCVTSDWVGATAEAVAHLARLGHQRLAALLPSSTNSTVRDHERGWHAGIAACDLDEREQTILRFGLGPPGQPGQPGQPGPEGGEREHARATIARLLSRDVAPTGVICSNDLRAHEVLRVAQETGVRVPDQLSVISFDDMIAAYTSPALCSFDPHVHELGEQAVALLGAALRGELTAPRRVMLPLDFRCRKSCGSAGR